jgi:hypothetical protein
MLGVLCQGEADGAAGPALGRAWSLMQGRHTPQVPETQLQET